VTVTGKERAADNRSPHVVAYSFKQRFVVPIRLGLGMTVGIVDDGTQRLKPKRQTIRAIGKRRHARPGETLQLYCGMRQPGCFLIGAAICTDTRAVKIVLSDTDFQIILNNSAIGLLPSEIRRFAQADGFDDEHDMLDFWREEHPGLDVFEGIVCEWRPAA